MINPKSRNLKQLEVDLETINQTEALSLLQENPKIMYRPIVTDGKKIAIGFKEDEFKLFS